MKLELDPPPLYIGNYVLFSLPSSPEPLFSGKLTGKKMPPNSQGRSTEREREAVPQHHGLRTSRALQG